MKRNFQRISILFLISFVVGISSTTVLAQGNCDQNSIVGSWRGTSGEGNGLLFSIIAGGNLISSVQTEVTLNPRLSVLTPGHGAWRYEGACQYTFTSVGLLYSIQTGKYTGYIKAKGRLNFNPAGPNVLVGTDKVFIYDPDGNLVWEVPEGNTSFVRTVVEPYN
ncbi:MAG TPA: hypothetical protein VFZ23_16275 [Pyrinomonadaceae bacterium]